MKKLILLLSLVFSVSFAMGDSKPIPKVDEDEREIAIRDIIVSRPGGIPRSALPTVQAWYEVTFNAELGVVRVAVMYQGMVVASATCDTSMQDMVYLAVPADEGFYTINIVSDQYEGEGEYTLGDY